MYLDGDDGRELFILHMDTLGCTLGQHLALCQHHADHLTLAQHLQDGTTCQNSMMCG